LRRQASVGQSLLSAPTMPRERDPSYTIQGSADLAESALGEIDEKGE
jgi:hypothetical protein